MAFPTTSVLDNFDRADAASLGANWSSYWGNGNFKILSNAAANPSAGWCGNYYNVATYGPDCEIFIDVTATATEYGLDLRMGGTMSAPNGYSLYISGSTWAITRVDNGSTTTLGSTFTQAISAGDSIGFSAAGSTLTAYYKASGGSWATVGSTTDATYGSAGYLAMDAVRASGTFQFDNFSGGTISSAITVNLNAANLSASAQTIQGQPVNIGLNAAALNAAPQAATASSPAFTFFGVASTPADNSTNTSSPTVITPPSSMQAGDLVIVQAVARASSGTLSISQAGGQTWTSLTQSNNTNCRRRVFWCIYNGTWSANPSVTMGSTTCNEAVMLVFRPTSISNVTVADVAEVDAAVSAPANPYTITITGQTVAANAVALAFWNVTASRTFGSLTGAGWSQSGLGAQYRCTSGSGETASVAYFIGQGATGNVSQNESAGTAGATTILSFKAILPTVVALGAATLTAAPQSIAVDAPASGLQVSLNAVAVAATAQAVTIVPGAVTPSLSAATLTAAPQTATASAISGLAVALNAAALAAAPGTVGTYAYTSNHVIYIGNGYTDGTPRQVALTSDSRIWVASWKFDNYPQGNVSGLGQTLRMYRADQVGTPSTFTRVDQAHEPVDVTQWALAVGANDTLHVLWCTRSSWSGGGVSNYLKYCTFDTVNLLWGTPVNIETALAMDEQGQGDESLCMDVDSNGDPHIVYLKNDGTNHRVLYRNKVGGSWSAATTIDNQSFSNGQHCRHPGIFFDQNGNRVVSWVRGGSEGVTDGRPFIRVYTGGAWGTTHDIAGADMWPGIDTELPIYIDAANRYHTAYLNTGKQIQYRYSDDLGATWAGNSPDGGTQLGDDPTVRPWFGNQVRVYAHSASAPYYMTYWQGHGGPSPWGARTNYSTSNPPLDSTVNTPNQRYFCNFPLLAVGVYWKASYPTNELYLGIDNATQATTVNLNAATVTASPQTLTAAPGARAVVLSVANLSATAQYIAPTTGAVTQPLNSASLTAAAQGITVVPGAVSLSLAVASLTAAPQAIAPSTGAVDVALNAASLLAEAQTAQAGPGPVWVRAYSAEMTAGAQAITVTAGAVSVSINAAQIAAGAQTVTPYVQAGGVVVSLNTAALAAAAQRFTVVPGPATVVLLAALATVAAGKLANTGKPDKLVLVDTQDWDISLADSQDFALTLTDRAIWALTLVETGGRNA